MYNEKTKTVNNSKYILRDYQEEAVKAGIEYFKSNAKDGGIIVAPTASGKSLIIASIAKELEGKTLVLQPSKEILEQNYKKAIEFGFEDIGIYSASCGRKDIGKITFATIGSIINYKALFEDFTNLIIDECHAVSAKGGMYEEFIKFFGGRVLGLTATPYRLHSYLNFNTGANESVVKFLTRTRPRMFSKLIHITQVEDLYKKGFLCDIDYESNKEYDQNKLELNSTGAGFTEKSMKSYNEKQGITNKIIDTVFKEKRNHVLAFCNSVEDAESVRNKLIKNNIIAEVVSSKTKDKDRENIVEMFISGIIKVVLNYGTMTTGFDFPALDCVIVGRPTKSLSLFYQMLGRGIRIHPDKKDVKIIDLCGNLDVFGKIETFKIIDKENRGLYVLVSNTGQLTGINIAAKANRVNNEVSDGDYSGGVESRGNSIVGFGKYKGQHVTKLPNHYLKWCSENFNNGNYKEMFLAELKRREK